MGGKGFVSSSVLSIIITVNVSILLEIKIAFTLVSKSELENSLDSVLSAIMPKIDSHSTEF